MQALISHTTTPVIVAAISEKIIENSARAVKLGADAIEIRLDMMNQSENMHETLSLQENTTTRGTDTNTRRRTERRWQHLKTCCDAPNPPRCPEPTPSKSQCHIPGLHHSDGRTRQAHTRNRQPLRIQTHIRLDKQIHSTRPASSRQGT